MESNQFYSGVLFELQKIADQTQQVPKINTAPVTNSTQTLSTPPAQPAKPVQAPWQRNYNSTGITNRFSEHNRSVAARAAQMATHAPLIGKPVENLIRKSVTDRFSNLPKDGTVPNIPRWQAAFLNQDGVAKDQFNKELANVGVNRIQNAGVGDLFNGQDSEDLQAYKEYGMANPEIAAQWQKAMADKTYNLGQLDAKGNPEMGDAKNFQWDGFLKDHWGKILLALLGIGGLGWLSNR